MPWLLGPCACFALAGSALAQQPGEPSEQAETPVVVRADPAPDAFDVALASILQEVASKGTPVPPDVEPRVLHWQTRLQEAKAMKITCEMQQDWRYLNRLDGNSDPVVDHHERFVAHAWMARDSYWLVVFAYEKREDGSESVDHQTPHLQQMWREGMIWERAWQPSYKAYRAQKYPAPTSYGAVTSGLDSKGCIYATVLGSWLADGGEVAVTQALKRQPRVAIFPPEGCPPGGVWLLGFEPSLDPGPDKDPVNYARVDYMLLSQEAEMTRWHTQVISRETARPWDCIAERRFKYKFFEGLPEEVVQTMHKFASLVEKELQSKGATASPKP